MLPQTPTGAQRGNSRWEDISEIPLVDSTGWQSQIRYSLPPPGFSESGIQLASATGKPLGFLWIHVQGFIYKLRLASTHIHTSFQH